jgi:hypothetical protein
MKHAQWAVLRAVVRLDGLKNVFGSAAAAKKNRFTISVLTKRKKGRIVLCTRAQADDR